MVNTPFPHSLKSECKKAAKILREFSIPSAKVGPDKIIPAGLIVNAQGLCILTVVKMGFLVTARGGSGIVIAKVRGGGWSAPSAIGIAGLGGGLEIGAEVTDFVIILNKQSAVEAFSKGGNLTLGGNFTIAAGPLGRNVEGDVSVRSPAAIYTYSKTKGLFAGISVEGSALIERKEANRKFYGESIRACEILNGDVDPPDVCDDLYNVLSEHESMFQKAALAYAKRQAVKEGKKAMAGGGVVAMVRKYRSGDKDDDSSTSDRDRTRGVSMRQQREVTTVSKSTSKRASSVYQRKETHTMVTKQTVVKSRQSFSQKSPTHKAWSEPEGATAMAISAWDAPPKCRAMWDFAGEQPYDLAFKVGDEITVLTRTATQDDWWEGTLHGRTGIFPANYVKVM